MNPWELQQLHSTMFKDASIKHWRVNPKRLLEYSIHKRDSHIITTPEQDLSTTYQFQTLVTLSFEVLNHPKYKTATVQVLHTDSPQEIRPRIALAYPDFKKQNYRICFKISKRDPLFDMLERDTAHSLLNEEHITLFYLVFDGTKTSK